LWGDRKGTILLANGATANARIGREAQVSDFLGMTSEEVQEGIWEGGKKGNGKTVPRENKSVRGSF